MDYYVNLGQLFQCAVCPHQPPHGVTLEQPPGRVLKVLALAYPYIMVFGSVLGWDICETGEGVPQIIPKECGYLITRKPTPPTLKSGTDLTLLSPIFFATSGSKSVMYYQGEGIPEVTPAFCV